MSQNQKCITLKAVSMYTFYTMIIGISAIKSWARIEKKQENKQETTRASKQSNWIDMVDLLKWNQITIHYPGKISSNRMDECRDYWIQSIAMARARDNVTQWNNVAMASSTSK